MQRPNFQMIEDLPEKNYMRFVSQYKLDDMVSLIFDIFCSFAMSNRHVLQIEFNSLSYVIQFFYWFHLINLILRWINWNCWIMKEHF